MTELCRYPITNTELKIDLTIEVFCTNLTYVRDGRTHLRNKGQRLLYCILREGWSKNDYKVYYDR